MNQQQENEAKQLLAEATKLLREGNLSPEETERLRGIQQSLSGAMLSNWLPFDSGRRIIMVVLVAIGLYGLSNGKPYLVLAWVLAALFSPRVAGELFYAAGRLFGK